MASSQLDCYPGQDLTLVVLTDSERPNPVRIEEHIA